MTQRRLRLACVLLGAVLGLLMIVLPLWLVEHPSPLYIAVRLSIGWSFVFAGAIAWARRPENRTGVLMTLTGLAWFGRNLYLWDAALPFHLADVGLNLVLALLAHQLIVFPHGQARSRLERLLVRSGYVLAVAGYVVPELFFDRHVEGCDDCPHDLLLVYGDHTAYAITNVLGTVLSLGLGVTILGRLLWRWWRASPPGRRALTPIACAAPAAVAVALATLANYGLGVSFGPLDSLLGWAAFVYVGIPIAFLVGLLRTRLHRTALGALVVELSDAPAPDQVQAALARALGDPSLEVAYWAPELETYVDPAGSAFPLPESDERAVTVLEQDGKPLAALVYDPLLLEDAAFVEAAGAAARLALGNARLQAELRAHLTAIQAPRARDLDDGGRQRPLGIGPGLQLAGYRIESLVARGGMSVVYRARDERLGRSVALKVLAHELADDERFRVRFLRESRIAASLHHPSIVPVYAAGEVEGLLYLAMRYVEGADLRAVLRRDGPLEPARALALLDQVADALDAAHGRGLVHRDVKPANVLIEGESEAERAYLADFGLTKTDASAGGSTAAGQLLGTIDYVAPEQIRGQEVDGRADVYSLGCVLHECLTGVPPFARGADVAVIYAHLQDEPPSASERRLELPRDIDAVLARALAKAPADRYATAGALVAAARGALADPRSRASAGGIRARGSGSG